MKKRITAFILLTAVMLLLAACGLDKGMELRQEQIDAEEAAKAKEAEEAADKEDKKTSEKKKDNKKDKEPEEGNEGESLAKRLCGKYSYHSPNGIDEEYYTIEILSFGDNLYGFAGVSAADEDSDEMEAYSFWTCEFIPDKASDLSSTTAKKVDVNMLNFSIMSNAGEYWGKPEKGSIELTDDGLVFDGFTGEGFLCPEDDSRLFLKDDRVQDTFVYLKGGKAERNDLDGYWVLDKKDGPIWLYFEGEDIYIYHKTPDEQVVFGAGSVKLNGKAKEGGFECKYSLIGSGDMPNIWTADYDIQGDELIIYTDDSSDIYDLVGDKAVFEKAEEKDIHVTEVSDLDLDNFEDTFFSDSMENLDAAAEEDGFYGIWVSATEDFEEAVKDARKLNDLGYDSYVAYSNEWENLTSEGYFCVSACRLYDEDEAGALLADVQMDGYRAAYVKHSGKHLYSTAVFTNHGNAKIVSDGKSVTFSNIMVSFPYRWYPGIDDISDEYEMTLVIDKDTVFDDTCETDCFTNYKNGDSPLDWALRNYDYMQNDPEKYTENGPAFSGVFEISINGAHIDRFFGSYWWD